MLLLAIVVLASIHMFSMGQHRRFKYLSSCGTMKLTSLTKLFDKSKLRILSGNIQPARRFSLLFPRLSSSKPSGKKLRLMKLILLCDKFSVLSISGILKPSRLTILLLERSNVKMEDGNRRFSTDSKLK